MTTNLIVQTKNISFSQIIWGNFWHRVNVRVRTWRLPMPDSIGEYRLTRVIEKLNSTENQYQFGVYQDAAGHTAIAKQWSGLVKDMQYFWLFNEIKVYEAINEICAKKSDVFAKEFPHISVPQLRRVVQEPTRLLLMTDFVEGEPLEHASEKEGIAAMEEAIQFFEYISNHITPQMSKFFVKRTLAYVVGNFFAMTLWSLIRYPVQIFFLMLAVGAFVSRLPALIKTNELKLVHRDITYFNILFQGNKLYLIDFELTVLTHPMFEITQILTGSWRRKEFWKLFYASGVMKKIFADKIQCDAYWALTVYTAIHRLATCPREEFGLHYSYLKHALEYPKVQEKSL